MGAAGQVGGRRVGAGWLALQREMRSAQPPMTDSFSVASTPCPYALAKAQAVVCPRQTVPPLTACLPQCLHFAHAMYVMVLPVSMMTLKRRGGVPRCRWV